MDYDIIFDTIKTSLKKEQKNNRDTTKLVYCSSLDHLNWYLPPQNWNDRYYFDKEEFVKNPNLRIEISSWIMDYCDGPVYIWNHCRQPMLGQNNYSDLISPSGEATLYFSKKTDYVQFILKFGK